MVFEWDDAKNAANVLKHGLSFEDAHSIFEAPMLIDLDDRFDYGEDRWIGIGSLQSRIVVIVYTERDNDTIRVIPMRKAIRQERERYGQAFEN